MSKQQSGFTLIELVVVIVILGLLAATALPRFVNVTNSARAASVQGVAGGLRSAASLAKAQVLVNGSAGCTGAATFTACMDGTAVAVNNSGYPTGGSAGGIVSAMQGLDGYTPSGASPNTVFQPTNGGSATCQAAYNENTGAVTVTSGGC